ncbi:MAG: hypothetical protein IPJ41_14310 [Phycisphaerales bacterium]|nr:hypothetical protein [Phycisphaerales bacterium]
MKDSNPKEPAVLLTARPTTLRSLCHALTGLIPEPSPRGNPPSEPAETSETSPVIDRIMLINPSATAAYLASFNQMALDRYLAHLESMDAPRGARWERPGDTCAIVVQETEF